MESQFCWHQVEEIGILCSLDQLIQASQEGSSQYLILTRRKHASDRVR